jgi:TRAP-type C4-dicarboxylate transport system permease small subunit
MEQRPGKFVRTVQLVCAALFAIMFAAFLIQVFSRYILDDPVPWTMEVSLIAYLWITFLAGGILVSIEEHISFDTAYDSARPGGKRILSLITSAAILLAFLLSLPANYDFVAFMSIDRTPILKVPFSAVFFGFLIFMVALIVRAVARIRRLTSASWREHL